MIHGYLLRGTGSNLFVNNLVKSFCKEGHNVFLFCQEGKADDLDFVSDHYNFDEDNKSTELISKKRTEFTGKCILYNPNLHGLLPVYVYDDYEELKVKIFTDVEDPDIRNYIAYNLQAVKTVHEEVSFDVLQSNHIIMSPYIARSIWKKYRVPYFITLHGSALNFTVKSDPKRFNPYAEKSLLDSEKIFAVSDHNRSELLRYFSDIALKIRSKITVIPAGVDVGTFNVLKSTRSASINRLCSILEEKIKKWPFGKSPEQKQYFLKELSKKTNRVESLCEEYNGQYNHRYPDTDVVKTLRKIDWERDKIIIFVGKYLQTKGIQIIINTLPLVIEKFPNLQLFLVGFGSYREELEALSYALQSKKRELFRYLTKQNFQFFKKDRSLPFTFLTTLEEAGQDDSYFETANKYAISENIHFTGFLNHYELGFLLPCSDVLIATSIIPEAFGMVAIEALSCGVFPILSYDAGFKDINQMLSSSLKNLPDLSKLYIDENMVFNLAKNITKILRNNELRKKNFKNNLRRTVFEYFSWEAVGKRYLHEYTHESR